MQVRFRAVVERENHVRNAVRARVQSYMVPLLLRLEGEPFSERGAMLYRFPELQKRARAEAAPPQRLAGFASSAARSVKAALSGKDAPALESDRVVTPLGAPRRPAAALRSSRACRACRLLTAHGRTHAGKWEYVEQEYVSPTRASGGQQLAVLALATLNGLLLSGAWGAVATRAGFTALYKVSPLLPPILLRGVLPFLTLYAAAYAFVPAVRAIAAAFKNSAAAQQNDARRQAAEVRFIT